MATLEDGELYSGLERNQTVVYAVTQIPLLSLQCCHDFSTTKLAYLILRKLHRTRKLCFENNITSLKDKPTDVNVFALSLMIYKQYDVNKREKEIHFSEKTIMFRPPIYNIYVCIQGVKKFRTQTLRVCRGDKTKPFCYVTNIWQVLCFLAGVLEGFDAGWFYRSCWKC